MLVAGVAVLVASFAAGGARSAELAACDAQHSLECRKAVAYWKHETTKARAGIEWQKERRRHEQEQRVLDARRGGSWPGFAIATIMVAAHDAKADYLAPQMVTVGRCESGLIAQKNHAGLPYWGWFQLDGGFRSDPLIVLLGWQSGYAQSRVVAEWVRVHGWGRWQCKPTGER